MFDPTPSTIQSVAYHEDAFMAVYWHEQTQWPTIQWKKFSATGAYRTAFDKFLELIQAKRSIVAVTDFENLTVLGSDDQAWVRDHWLPSAARAGLRHLGVIMPKEHLAKASLLKGLRYADATQLEIGYFHNRIVCMQWISPLARRIHN
ncbi:hypothetical protein K1X84_00585 [bacterium]|nr:hypothetical protein [bacterium]